MLILQITAALVSRSQQGQKTILNNWKSAIYNLYQIDMNLIQVRFFLQANGGKYQLQNEKTQQSLEKAQSEFDRLQEKFERLTNDSRRVSHSYHYHNTDIPLP